MSDHDDLREFAAALFGKDGDGAHDKEAPPRTNVVPDEGKTPSTPPRDEMRDFARDLFGFTD